MSRRGKTRGSGKDCIVLNKAGGYQKRGEGGEGREQSTVHSMVWEGVGEKQTLSSDWLAPVDNTPSLLASDKEHLVTFQVQQQNGDWPTCLHFTSYTLCL